MRFWSFKKKIYPIFVFLASLFLIVFGLCMARNVKCSYFLAGCFVWLMLFGCRKGCFRVLPAFIIVGGLFAVIAYFAYGKDLNTAIAMANRFASVFLAAALGMSVEPADMTRNLSTLKMPRGVTLGMLIATSFPPVLGAEIKRVREAMKTRGQRVKPENLLQSVFSTVRNATRKHIGYVVAVGGNARIFA